MTKIPIPMFGVNGIRFLARRMRRWERGMGKKRAALNLAQVIRMNEEIGTGGAGFRFIYAAFLQEAANTMNMPELRRFSEEMTSAGDMWRDFSYNAARMFKKRDGDTITYDILAAKLMKIADKEELIFKGLEKLMRDAG